MSFIYNYYRKVNGSSRMQSGSWGGVRFDKNTQIKNGNLPESFYI